MSRLYCGKSDKELKVGDTTTTFRGEKVKILSWDDPRSDASTGRVSVEGPGGSQGSYYPSVINAVILQDDDCTLEHGFRGSCSRCVP